MRRSTSATGVPVSACFSANAICSSVNLLFFTAPLLPSGSHKTGKLAFKPDEKNGETSDAAAKDFGWDKRQPRPGSIRDGDWLVGWGCAATMYPTQMGPAAARVTLTPQGTVKVQTAAHDIGTGAYTVIALTAADRLGVALDKIVVKLGDSDLPPAPVAGGSNTTASVCNVVAMACEQIRRRIAAAAVAAANGAFAGKDAGRLVLAGGGLQDPDGAAEPLDTAVRRVSNGAIEAYAENTPHGVPPDGLSKLYQGHAVLAGGAKMKDRI